MTKREFVQSNECEASRLAFSEYDHEVVAIAAVISELEERLSQLVRSFAATIPRVPRGY